MIKYIYLFVIFCTGIVFSQNYKVLESNDRFITVQVNFEDNFTLKDTIVNGLKYTKINSNTLINTKIGEPDIPKMFLSFGIPFNSNPKIEILNINYSTIDNKFVLPVPEYGEDGEILNYDNFNKEIYSSNKYYPINDVFIADNYIARFTKILNVQISPILFNPVKKQIKLNKKIVFKLTYNELDNKNFIYNYDAKADEYLRLSVVNYDIAKQWMGIDGEQKEQSLLNSRWYNPNKEYFKIYLNKKGVYRIKYDDLLAAGLDETITIDSKKLELFCNGVKIPIDVFTKKDSLFSKGSYLQFCGYPPTPTPYAKLNIYNNTNVYWLSYQADSVGYQFKNITGKPLVWGKSFVTNKRLLHYERDTIYERLGYADNSNRDYWFWGKASGENGTAQEAFFYTFPTPPKMNTDSVYIKLRVSMHGLTTGVHKADIMLTSQPVGSKSWTGQQEAIFETTFKLGEIGIFPQNTFQVFAKGEFERDEIRINWFELEYWQYNEVNGESYIFTAPNNTFGKTLFIVYRWTADTMLVYIPDRGEVIRDSRVTHNQWDNVEFVDQVYLQHEYFCVSLNAFLTPDSIRKNVNSDLYNTNQGADYIIITHPKFTEVANKLALYRSNNLTGFTNPRVKVVNVMDIYNEFSSGLMDPFAIREFIKHAYFNWQRPAPSYVVLLGDMSYDYRKIFPTSRENFIPSIPYQSFKYGQAVADNMFVAVDGVDVIPDISIGRISIETVAEGEAIINKMINYPLDKTKEWRQRVNLYSAGQSASDENYFRFNDENQMLDNNFINLKGYSTYKVYAFPNKPEYSQFIGGTPEMKNGFNEGAIITNFFGHGGGYQWDLFFLNDHIYQLTNFGKPTFITSITCYTAHFDNQDVFGEQFIKVPEKGAIGFWGHTGITFWPQGKSLNAKLFSQIFNNKVFVVGDAIRYAKADFPNGMTGLDADHIALLTLLGDPAVDLAFVRKPDFKMLSENIDFEPDYPLVNDEVKIKLKVINLGTVFPNDSVSVKITLSSADTTYTLPVKYMQSFGELDSISFYWKPNKAGLYTVKANINNVNSIDEEDLSDNEAAKNIAVYNVKETNIISPENGAILNTKRPKFIIADPSIYLNKNYTYFIEIDTSINFTNPMYKSPELTGNLGITEWSPSTDLKNGVYFWRSRIKDVEQAPYWSNLSTFLITDNKDSASYYISSKQLKLFNTNNIYYHDDLQSLVLNLSKLPPKPSNSKFIEDIYPDSVDGLQSYTAITTDGKYFYIGHIAYYGGPTLIHKFGTGNDGTEKGKYYGVVSNQTLKLWHSLFYLDNNLYSCETDPNKLIRLNLSTSSIDTIIVEDGFLDLYSCKVKVGAFVLKTDGNLIYNISVKDSVGQSRYTIRRFDPNNNFKKYKDDLVFTGTSFDGFTDFFVYEKYAFVYENFMSGFMRRLNMETGEFEDADWLTYYPFQGYYGWTYDKVNDNVYATVYKTGKTPKISKFAGSYFQTFGNAVSPEVSNVKKWKKAEYFVNSNGSNGNYFVSLEGFNTFTNTWVTISDSVASTVFLDTLNAEKYKSLRFRFFFSDTSRAVTNPLEIKWVKFYYEGLPEIQISNASLSFSPDSLMQGFPITMNFMTKNYGSSVADSVRFDFILNNSGVPLYSTKLKIPADSVGKISYNINTSPLLFNNKVKVEGHVLGREKYTFNNIGSNSFYVSRDSINPTFTIRFDGEEIINGDIISAKPVILMTLKDNSPLPLDSTYFYVYHNNVQVSKDSLRFSYTPYPNSTAYLTWNPTLRDGTHYLEVLARDASLNYFDTTTYKIWFVVKNKNEIREIFNYPNPFNDGTYFTFNMTGTKKPEEIKIKIYTMAGRLIKNLEIPTEPLKFGFNKFYWNGKDEDGDEIGNGVYFYKIIITEDGVTKSETKKIVKMK